MRAWRAYVKDIANQDAQEVGGRVVKFQPSMDTPRDYGLGYKQAVGTAYVEVKTSGGSRGGIVYSADLHQLDGTWSVKTSSFKRQKPEDVLP
jgi:hypothetical protein